MLWALWLNLSNLWFGLWTQPSKIIFFILNLHLTYIFLKRGPKKSPNMLGHRPPHVGGPSSPSLHVRACFYFFLDILKGRLPLFILKKLHRRHVAYQGERRIIYKLRFRSQLVTGKSRYCLFYPKYPIFKPFKSKTTPLSSLSHLM